MGPVYPALCCDFFCIHTHHTFNIRPVMHCSSDHCCVEFMRFVSPS